MKENFKLKKRKNFNNKPNNEKRDKSNVKSLNNKRK
jgi:hypothetical protein